MRCGVLREIAEVGFVDLKEAGPLPAIARKYSVVVEHREAASLTLRTARDYLFALRHDHRRQRGEAVEQNPFAEDWQAEFSVVEEGATVATSASRLFDSGGAGRWKRGGETLVLVRTIVCPGASVKANQRKVDELVTSTRSNRGVVNEVAK